MRASDEQKSDSERATANGASDDGDAQGADQDTKKQDGPLYAEDDIDRVRRGKGWNLMCVAYKCTQTHSSECLSSTVGT